MTSMPFTLVEHGDPSAGVGFAHFVDPGRPAPAKPFVVASEKLLRKWAMQPPEGATASDRFPVWGLFAVEVEGRGPHWCFTVQGREGGGFSRSGSCQFLFAEDQHDPLDVWTSAVAMVGPDGRLGHFSDPGRRLPPPVAVEPVLTDLAADSTRVIVDGDPREVASTIAALLRVLPRAVVRSRVWLTYVLKPPVLGSGVHLVCGRWPDALANPDASRAHHWLEQGANGVRLIDGKGREALALIAAQAQAGRPMPGYRDEPSMASFVSSVAQRELDVDITEVPSALRHRPERLRTPNGRAVLTRWAAANTEAAISFLVAYRLDADLRGVIFDGLLAAHRTAPGTNPVRFPPRPAGPHSGWHHQLADLLRAKFPARDHVAEFVRTELLAPGKPLHSPRDLEKATSWLVEVGLAPDDPIFPLPVDRIAERLATGAPLTTADRDRLAGAEKPADAVRAVIDRVYRLLPRTAAELIDLVPQADARQEVLEEVIGGFSEAWGDHWLDEFLGRWSHNHVKVLELAFAEFDDVRQAPDELVARALRMAAEGASDLWRDVLLEGAERVMSPSLPEVEDTEPPDDTIHPDLPETRPPGGHRPAETSTVEPDLQPEQNHRRHHVTVVVGERDDRDSPLIAWLPLLAAAGIGLLLLYVIMDRF
ncbi:hypothetical protein ACWGE0_43765 [Lentzea sp. NPDC054927]